MEDYSWIPALIGGLGIGSLATTVLTTWLADKRDKAQYLRDRKEKAYVGLLRAYSDAMNNSGERERHEFLHWHFQVQLFGAKDVDRIVHELYAHDETKPGSQIEIRERLITAMRSDLGIPRHAI